MVRREIDRVSRDEAIWGDGTEKTETREESKERETRNVQEEAKAPPICSSRNISTTFDAHKVAHNLLIQSVKSATSPLSRVGCVL